MSSPAHRSASSLASIPSAQAAPAANLALWASACSKARDSGLTTAKATKVDVFAVICPSQMMKMTENVMKLDLLGAFTPT